MTLTPFCWHIYQQLSLLAHDMGLCFSVPVHVVVRVVVWWKPDFCASCKWIQLVNIAIRSQVRVKRIAAEVRHGLMIADMTVSPADIG